MAHIAGALLIISQGTTVAPEVKYLLPAPILMSPVLVAVPSEEAFIAFTLGLCEDEATLIFSFSCSCCYRLGGISGMVRRSDSECIPEVDPTEMVNKLIRGFGERGSGGPVSFLIPYLPGLASLLLLFY